MHIEPGVVDGAKIVLSYATGLFSLGLVAKLVFENIIKEGGTISLALRSIITSVLVFCFFEILPHYAVGVSEVHLILGSTLFLIFGAAPAAIGLALGLLVQGLLFEPADIPQYGMNATTLLVPLYAMSKLAGRAIPVGTAYKDVSYRQALTLSTSFQAGIVAWVGFWAVYGQGFTIANLANVASFGIAYMSVIIVEPLIDLAILALAKLWHYQLQGSLVVQPRLYKAIY